MMNEHKKGTRAKIYLKHSKPATNPVARAAQSVAKGSGEHKNPKTAVTQPRKAKHKKAEMMESVLYVVENDMTDFFKNLQKTDPKFKNIRVHGDSEHDELRRQDAEKRQQQQTSMKAQGEQDAQARVEQDRANLPQLKDQLAHLTAEYKRYGGDSWQYADRMTDNDRKAQSISRQINVLQSKIAKAEQGVAEGTGNFAKAIDNLHGWYQDKSRNPDIEVYKYDDREGGFYADGTVYHNIKTGRVKIKFGDQHGNNIDDTFNSIGDAMNVLRSISSEIHPNTGKAQNFDRLGGRSVAGPDDVYKTDRAGKKGTLTKSRMDTMKMTSPYRKTGPKGVLPEGLLKEDIMGAPPPESNHEATMALSELYRNAKYGMALLKIIEPNDAIDGWVQANLTSAASMLDKVYHYLDYKNINGRKPEMEDVEEDDNVDDTDASETDGSMARENLEMIVEYSIKLMEMIKPGDNLASWVSMKLTKASEAVSSSKHFIEYRQFEKHTGDMMEGRLLRMLIQKISE